MNQAVHVAMTGQRDASQCAPSFLHNAVPRVDGQHWFAPLVIVVVCVVLGSSAALAQPRPRPTNVIQIDRPVPDERAAGRRSEYRSFFTNPRPLAEQTLAPISTYEPRHFEWVTTAINLPLPSADVINAAYAGPLVDRGGDGSVHAIRHTDDYSEVWYTNYRVQDGVQQWHDPVSLVSANATYLSGNGRYVAVDGAGQAHFIGANAAKSQVWYRSFDGTGLTPEVQIRQASPDAIQSLAIAVERGGMQRIVWVEGDQLLAVNGVGSSPSVLLPFGASGSSVSIFIDEYDNAHLLQLMPGTGQIRYAQAAVGQAWNPFVLLSAANDPVIADYAFGPDGSLHILFTRNCPVGYLVITNGTVTRSEIVPFYQNAMRRVRLGTISTGDPYFFVDYSSSGTDKLYTLDGTEWRLLTSLTWPTPLDPVPGDLLVGPDDSLTLVTESYANGSETSGGSSLIVAKSAIYNAGAADGQVLAVDQRTRLDVTNGGVTIGLSLFSTASLGPQAPIGLTYNPLALHGAVSTLPSGWRLSTEQRVWHSQIKYYGKFYQPSNPDINQVWLQTASGTTVTFASGSQPDEYVVTAREGIFLRLVRNPADSTWVLNEANGTIHGFSATGLIDWTKDASNNMLDYQYDPNGKLEQIVDATGRATTFMYDGNSQLSTIVDPSGQEYTLSYYGFGEAGGSPSERLLKSVTRSRSDGPDETWQFSYHAATNETAACPSPLPGTCPTKRGLLATFANPRGFSTKYYYEIGSRLARVVNADNKVLAAAYARLAGQVNVACASLEPSSNDLFTAVTDWRGFVSTYETNFEDATVWRTTDPNGQAMEQSFDTYRRLICQRDKRGFVSTYDWLVSPPSDFVRFQLENIHRPGIANPIHYTYTADHEVQTVTDSLGHVTTYGYADPNNPHLVTSMTEPPGVSGGTSPVTQLAYDSQGRLQMRTDPMNHVTTNGYNDPLTGLVTSIDRPDIAGNETFAYNVMGQVLTHKQPAHSSGVVTSYEYDGAHRLKRTTFPATVDHGSSSIVNTYDQNGNLLTVTDQLNKLTAYEYDVLDRKTKITRHDGSFSRTEYDPNGNVTNTYDFNNSRTQFEYDALNRLVLERRFESVNGQDMKFGYEYDANGNRTKLHELNPDETIHSTTEYQYDQLNRLTQTIYPATVDHGPSSVINAYDNNSNLLTVTDQRGNVSRHCYTNRNLLKATKRTGGEVDFTCSDPAYRTDYTYDLNGNRETMTVYREDSGVSQPKTTTYEYDAVNRLVRTRDPLLRETITDYDDNGNVTLVTDPLAMATKTEYDTLNRQKRVISDFGRKNLTTSNAYNQVGNVTSSTDATGRITSNTYDSLHRLILVTMPDSTKAQYTYDANGNRKTVVDAKGQITAYTYDGLNRVIRETDPLNKRTDTTYDEFGNVIRRVQADDRTSVQTDYSHDVLHRLKVTDYANSTPDVTRTYDPAGNLLTIVDANSSHTFMYDSLNRMVVDRDNALGRELRYAYDSFDQRTSMSDYHGGALQDTVTYQYDDAAQIDKILRGSDQYDFNHHSDGTRQSLIRPNGARTDYQYDTAKQLDLLSNQKPDAAVVSAFAYQYDNVGNRTRMDVTLDGALNHTIQYDYDNLYRLMSETRSGAVPNTVSWTYDPAGNRLSETRNGAVKYTRYNQGNEVLREVIPGVETFVDDFEQEPLNGWSAESGTWSEFFGRLRTDTSPRSLLQASGRNGSTFSSSVDLMRIDTALGIAFNIQSPSDYLVAELMRDPIRSSELPILTNQLPIPCTSTEDDDIVIRGTRFTLEGLQVRISHVTAAGSEVVSGVWAKSSCNWHTLRIDVEEGTVDVYLNDVQVLNVDNLPLQSGGVGLTADGNGMFNDFSFSRADVFPCMSDERGNSGDCGRGTPSYDSENRQTQFTSGTTTTTYTYDAFGRRIKKTVNDNGNISIEQYYYDGDDVLLDLDGTGNVVLRRYVNGLGIDEKLAVEQDGINAFFLTDALGSTRELVDASSAVQTRFDYEAFGKPTALMQNVPTRYQFTGREYEAESGLYYYRARMMDPNLGRFTGRDPVAGAGENQYVYVGNNPVNYLDSFGLDEHVDKARAEYKIQEITKEIEILQWKLRDYEKEVENLRDPTKHERESMADLNALVDESEQFIRKYRRELEYIPMLEGAALKRVTEAEQISGFEFYFSNPEYFVEKGSEAAVSQGIETGIAKALGSKAIGRSVGLILAIPSYYHEKAEALEKYEWYRIRLEFEAEDIHREAVETRERLTGVVNNLQGLNQKRRKKIKELEGVIHEKLTTDRRDIIRVVENKIQVTTDEIIRLDGELEYYRSTAEKKK
ncbi:MAG: hypothetical protein HY567_00700 [Candidatus Kerfeldbacteria bacterium]|nr:hypothetical protein [Candidatus Kerfeldbacteria bacterium]